MIPEIRVPGGPLLSGVGFFPGELLSSLGVSPGGPLLPGDRFFPEVPGGPLLSDVGFSPGGSLEGFC